MKRLKLFILSLVTVFSFGSAALVPAMASADSAAKDAACAAIGGCDQDTTTDGSKSKVTNVIQTFINILSWVVGVVSVIMIIIGGFKFITSGGDSAKVKSAREAVIYALVGLVIVALAQVIVAFVINNVTK